MHIPRLRTIWHHILTELDIHFDWCNCNWNCNCDYNLIYCNSCPRHYALLLIYCNSCLRHYALLLIYCNSFHVRHHAQLLIYCNSCPRHYALLLIYCNLCIRHYALLFKIILAIIITFCIIIIIVIFCDVIAEHMREDLKIVKKWCSTPSFRKILFILNSMHRMKIVG